ncbi:RnfH family protein [Arenimonas composti]|uniref:RnfH family protein n=1 Tax=Arenimonas composti TaxID=370776 RepID=UPI00047A8B09|nr:RnfH family protein [Arenimonas composti]
MRVEIVYALPDRCARVEVTLPAGATVADALRAANLAETMPEAEVDPARLAVYGRLATAEAALHDGDRIELLRPLRVDPKQARRRRATGGPAP